MKNQNVILIPSSETQLQHWIDKLKEAGVAYDIVTNIGKSMLEVDRAKVSGVLDIEKIPQYTKTRKLSLYLLGFSFLFLFVVMCIPDQKEEATVAPLSPEEQVVADSLAVVANRTAMIEKQFSAWDGSHLNLSRAIKKSMNDPDSYEHVETRYWDKGDHLVVKTTFRGANAFGGKVLNSVSAVVDMSGNIIEVTQE